MKDEGTIPVAEALHNNHTLEKLDIRNNGVMNHGLLSLAQALRLNNCMEKLYVWGNTIDNNAAQELQSAMHASKGVQVDIQVYEVNGVPCVAEQRPPTQPRTCSRSL